MKKKIGYYDKGVIQSVAHEMAEEFKGRAEQAMKDFEKDPTCETFAWKKMFFADLQRVAWAVEDGQPLSVSLMDVAAVTDSEHLEDWQLAFESFCQRDQGESDDVVQIMAISEHGKAYARKLALESWVQYLKYNADMESLYGGAEEAPDGLKTGFREAMKYVSDKVREIEKDINLGLIKQPKENEDFCYTTL